MLPCHPKGVMPVFTIKWNLYLFNVHLSMQTRLVTPVLAVWFFTTQIKRNRTAPPSYQTSAIELESNQRFGKQ